MSRIQRLGLAPLWNNSIVGSWSRSASLTSIAVSCRHQSQSVRGKPGLPFSEGTLDPRYSAQKSMRVLNPDTMAHYVKATIQNDRREMGLPEVFDWHEFARDAVMIPTRSGQLWVGADDPRCAKFIRRREKMKESPLHLARKQIRGDPAKDLEDHPFREYFTTAANLNDPLTIAKGLHVAGMIKEADIKFTAAKISYRPRPPVVSIMGHVDHGKTTLLDYLRKTNVAAGEAGGITQSVGAFRVQHQDNWLTFIDTPGHAAFTTMREAGAAATDLIIVVISAVDGVQPQTREVVEIAQRHHIPMVIACNKIDRQPNVDGIKAALRDLNVELEEDGGDTQLVKVCARDGTGVDALLEAVLLQAALSEIVTPVPARSELTVIESRQHSVSEVAAIVRTGTVKVGQWLVCGMSYGRVQKISDERGQPLTSADAGTPVFLQGFKVHPKPGSIMMQVSSEDHAEKFYRFTTQVFEVEGKREAFLQTLNQEQMGRIYDRKPDNNIVRAYSTKPFLLCCKAATFGMLQALMKMVYELPRLEGVSLQVRVTEVGGCRDADVGMIGVGGQPACVLLYGDTVDTNHMSWPSHVVIHRFSVLYHGIEALKKTLVDAMPEVKRTRVAASAECIQTFRASQAEGGNAAGCKVTSGTLIADHLTYRVKRKGKKPTEEFTVVYEGQIRELRRFKDIVPSVEKGLECGVILFDDFNFRVGDVLEMVEEFVEERDVEEEFQRAAQRERASPSAKEEADGHTQAKAA